ncbi:MAG TPA: glycoside hydrolase family 38 C-terminal domain-containing protein, partial [Microbacteriaceae bacterium]|nr:glycoside hydrolase family 38 C-terminal domain-containing protein [Microbacteriaceae bacterium]
VHGKRYFLEKFGVESEEVWLPDSFGYSAALPQIAALAGFRWFLTQKLAWNPTNKFPHHTFWWEGIDGTRLFSHMPPVDSYLSELSAAELDHATKNFAEHAGATTSVVPFGHGDGGGGPTALMLERARRQANLEGSPTIEHTTPAAYFQSAEAEYPDAPTWVGELYLEAHRGTYTSQAAMKRGNRRTEHLLREAELWCASAAIRTDAAYPYDALDRLWKVVLLHQFHDILPGSSIAWVHREAAEAYEAVVVELEAIIAEAIGALAGTGDVAIQFNAAPVTSDEVPALGASAVRPAVGGASVVHASRTADGIVLDNGILRVSIDSTGAITSILDQRHDREVITPGTRANALVLHQDLPNAFDAWDVESHYRATAREVDGLDRIDLEQTQDCGATVVVHRSFGASATVQRTTLRPGAAQVDFTIDTDWHEAEQFLKVTFPVDVRAKNATSEIQFGHISRPTHQNTSRDAEQFEICAHRWVHVGEPRFGVAIANDSTYGHDIRRRDDAAGGRPGTEIRLSLLRAPRYPDPTADQGHHSAAYSLVSGADIEDAVAAGLRLNLPIRTVRGQSAPEPLVRATGDGVIVESVKLAEDRSGDIIIRIYESLGARTTARIGWDVPTAGVAIVDLLERELEPLPNARDEASIALRPFQIVTLRIARDHLIQRSRLEEEIG